MTNYGRDPLEELWKEILEIHWKYLESEENMDKIEERRLLEGRLKEYISVVTHNRKFFLPETENVLRRSVTQARDFSAFKCADGFESISHYANNLFTKPWRKEYRVIKMFSGFYQHEIKNNLMNAEELFIAMGYKLLPNNTLVLEGPICPDQVTNVSRDALTAYVECQIMKQINADLASMGLTTTWQEIYSFRERHVGDSSQSIKGLAQLIQSRHNHVMRKDSYACSVPASLLASHQIAPPNSSSHYQQPSSHMHNNQNICGSHCNAHPSPYAASPLHNQIPPPPLPPATSSYYSSPSYNQPCSLHSNYVPAPPPAPGNSYYQQSQQNLPHSKSLDQYEGAKQVHANGNLHRLSLDQTYKLNHPMHPSPVATGPFDCIETAAYNHPYNQPNVRSPLPYNLSNNPLGQAQSQQAYYPPQWDYYHQLHQQSLPTPVNDYKSSYTDFTDSSSPAMPDSELISFNDTTQSNRSENKLRSSLKKSIQEQEHDLDMLRSLKRRDKDRDLTSFSESSSRTHDEIMAELDSLRITSNGHGPPKGHSSKGNGTLPNASNAHLAAASSSSSAAHSAKLRTKSVSTTTESSNHHHEHKRTSSVMETSGGGRSNSDKYKPPQQPQIHVPPGEWSCRFCTFLNPDAKKICDMCSKSKDFFLDTDKSSKSAATATCV